MSPCPIRQYRFWESHPSLIGCWTVSHGSAGVVPSMIDPKQAAVRPRVIAEGSRGTVLLEDLVAELAAAGDVAVLTLCGPRGAGITTALRHLQHLFGSQTDFMFTDVDSGISFDQQSSGIIAFRMDRNRSRHGMLKCKLAGWDRDEWIEYLLAVHRDRCASVMRRIHHDPHTVSLCGNPNLWSQILDKLAADDGLTGVKDALIQIIERTFPDAESRAEMERFCFWQNTGRGPVGRRTMEPQRSEQRSVEQVRLLLVPAVVLLMASRAAWDELQTLEAYQVRDNWPRELVEEVGTLVSKSPVVQDKLRSWLVSRHRNGHPLAVSLLHAAKASWQLEPTRFFGILRGQLNLAGAFLEGADCSKLKLARCEMTGAAFSQANFTGTNLRKANATSAQFDGACLRHARLTRFHGSYGCFANADLSDACGTDVIFNGADLSFANLTNAKLANCWFANSNLSNAILHGADLRKSCFLSSRIDAADFIGANLEFAAFSNLDLTVAQFERACFRSAQLSYCNMEGIELPDADFDSAILHGAVMTGSVLPRASFARAELTGARLAEVEWESVNLQYADLTGATFHMGSTRSGLVGSSIPSYGSRTGFYTDELNEQDFKAPEEIRKANLRGADLRGARIDHVDFYLVDLRDALYDPDQEDQLRRTGAILVTRT